MVVNTHSPSVPKTKQCSVHILSTRLSHNVLCVPSAVVQGGVQGGVVVPLDDLVASVLVWDLDVLLVGRVGTTLRLPYRWCVHGVYMRLFHFMYSFLSHASLAVTLTLLTERTAPTKNNTTQMVYIHMLSVDQNQRNKGYLKAYGASVSFVNRSGAATLNSRTTY